MKTITTKDGTQIYYKDWGSGQPVVFSHGWPLSSDSWESQMLFLASNGYRCIAHDRRGHGRSSQPWDGNDMNTYADDLATLLDTLELKNAVLVGFSAGGGEVARYIGRHGTKRLAKAALISAVPPLMLKTAANPGGLPIKAFDDIRAGSIADRSKLYQDIASGPFFGFNRPGAKISQGMIDWFWLQGMQAGHKNTLDCIKAFSETDFTEDLEKFDVPTLIIHGDDDQIVPIGAAGLSSSKLVKNSILKVYAGAPHGLTATHKEQLNADLLTFLQEETLAGEGIQAQRKITASMVSKRTPTAKMAAVTRRDFIKRAAVGGVAVSVIGASTWAEEEAAKGMIYRTLGSTGQKVSAIGLGGFHIGNPLLESESLKIIRTAIDRGITFMDNCWDYHEGKSEVRMGKALRDGYRDKVFLMTKIDGRSKTGAAAQIDECLRRLQTDHVDLLQFHEIIRMDDPDRIFAAGGALEAVLEAKKAGKLRYIGFTGHKDPSIHLHMLRLAAQHQFRFDTVQMPLNVMDAHFRSFEQQVLPVLIKEQIGVLGMKSMGSGDILKSKAVQPIECLHYALNLPTSVVITGIDSLKLLDQAFEAVRTFKPMSSTQVATLLARTADVARDGKYELFKTAQQYDSTSKNPEFLN